MMMMLVGVGRGESHVTGAVFHPDSRHSRTTGESRRSPIGRAVRTAHAGWRLGLGAPCPQCISSAVVSLANARAWRATRLYWRRAAGRASPRSLLSGMGAFSLLHRDHARRHASRSGEGVRRQVAPSLRCGISLLIKLPSFPPLVKLGSTSARALLPPPSPRALACAHSPKGGIPCSHLCCARASMTPTRTRPCCRP